MDDNGKYLWESHSICTYLIDKYSTENNHLYPKDYYIRGCIDQRLHFNSNVLKVLSETFFKPVIYRGANDFNNEYRIKIQDAYKSLELFFSTNNQFLVGNEMTIADITCGCNVLRLSHIEPIDDQCCPNSCNWLMKLLDNEYFHQLNLISWTELKKNVPAKYHVSGDKIFQSS